MRYSIFDCKWAKGMIDIIHCEKGNELNYNRGDLDLSLAQEGKPLSLDICKDCPDFESMSSEGEPPVVLDEDKGWPAT